MNRMRNAGEESDIPPSTWQRKFKNKTCPPKRDVKVNDLEDDKSLDAWIARATAKAEAIAAPLTPAVVKFDEPVDSEVADVIRRMEAILSDRNQNQDIGDEAQQNDIQLEDDDFYQLEFGELSFDFAPFDASSEFDFVRDVPLNLTEEQLFSNDHMVALFSKSRDEKIMRKALRSLAKYCRHEKKRLTRTAYIVQKKRRGKMLGRAFLSWKDRCRVVQVRQNILVVKFGRVTSKRFRKAFLAWKHIATAQSELENEVIDKLRLRRLSRAMSEWILLTKHSKNQLEMQEHQFVLGRKARIVSAWARSVRLTKAHREKMAQKNRQAKLKYATQLLRFHLTLWLQSHHQQKAKQAEPIPENNAIATPANTAARTPLRGSSNDRGVPHSTRGRISKRSARRGHSDKENEQPNLLSPLSAKKRAPSFNSPTPKLVLDMEIRRKEREQRRHILKLQQDEKQRQRKEQEEQRRRLKEEQELQLHNAYLKQKAEEEERKQMELVCRKQAWKLASLHYKMTLCRRIFHQWTKIFQLMVFNEQKACLFWSDLVHEKCFNCWRLFKDNAKRCRVARMLERQRLADDFNRVRLFSKSLAAWEAYCSQNKSNLHQALKHWSTNQQSSILAKWHNLTLASRTDWRLKEESVDRIGIRLSLRFAIYQWRSGAAVSRKEREIAKLVDEKRKEVYSWLGEL